MAAPTYVYTLELEASCRKGRGIRLGNHPMSWLMIGKANRSEDVLVLLLFFSFHLWSPCQWLTPWLSTSSSISTKTALSLGNNTHSGEDTHGSLETAGIIYELLNLMVSYKKVTCFLHTCFTVDTSERSWLLEFQGSAQYELASHSPALY